MISTILSLVLLGYGAEFLSYYPGAQQVGMAGAGASLAGGAYAVFYNPASSGFLKDRCIGIECNTLPIDDSSYYWAVVGTHPLSGALAVSVFASGYTVNYASVDAHAWDMAPGVGVALRATPQIGIGLNLKLISTYRSGRLPGVYSVTNDPTAVTAAADLGVRAATRIRLGELAAGLAAQNLGPPLVHGDTLQMLPVGLRGGVSYTLNANDVLSPQGRDLFAFGSGTFWDYMYEHWRLILTYDINAIFGQRIAPGFMGSDTIAQRPFHSLGIEVRPVPFVALRFGYFRDMTLRGESYDYPNGGWTTGLGLDFKYVQLDIADDLPLYYPSYLLTYDGGARLRVSLAAAF